MNVSQVFLPCSIESPHTLLTSFTAPIWCAPRHSILKQCKMDDTLLPMTRGNMADIENEGSENNLEYSSGMDTQVRWL